MGNFDSFIAERFPGPNVDSARVLDVPGGLCRAAVSAQLELLAVNWVLSRFTHIELPLQSATYYQVWATGLAIRLQIEERDLLCALPRVAVGVQVHLFQKSKRREVVEVVLVSTVARIFAVGLLSQKQTTANLALWLPLGVHVFVTTIRYCDVIRRYVDQRRKCVSDFEDRVAGKLAKIEAKIEKALEQCEELVCDTVEVLRNDSRTSEELRRMFAEKFNFPEDFVDQVIAGLERARSVVVGQSNAGRLS